MVNSIVNFHCPHDVSAPGLQCQTLGKVGADHMLIHPWIVTKIVGIKLTLFFFLSSIGKLLLFCRDKKDSY